MKATMGASPSGSGEVTGVKERTTLGNWCCNWFEIWMKLVSKLMPIIPYLCKKHQKPREGLISLKHL